MSEKIILQYVRIEVCPLCSGDGEFIGKLNRGCYRFGTTLIHYPESGSIPLKRCRECGLIYKEWVPEREDVLRLFRDWTPRSWHSKSPRSTIEADLSRRFRPRRDQIDVLDIGGSDGTALGPLAKEPGHRSVLDIVEYPGVRKAISGELILGFAEDDLTWSGNQYNIVLAFDLMEHLHNPAKAIDNIARFTCNNGVFIVHTADASKALSEARDGIDQWWYLNLFEHHIAWPYETLVREMKKRDFVPVYVEHGSHKQWNYAGFLKKQIVLLLKHFQEGRLVRTLSEVFLSIDPRQLADPRKNDHMTIVFKKQTQQERTLGAAGLSTSFGHCERQESYSQFTEI